jgi:hypothetical protein
MGVARRQSSPVIEDMTNVDLVDWQVLPWPLGKATGASPPDFEDEAATSAVELHHQVVDAVRQTAPEMREGADESAFPESRHKARLEGTHHSLAVFSHASAT